MATFPDADLRRPGRREEARVGENKFHKEVRHGRDDPSKVTARLLRGGAVPPLRGPEVPRGLRTRFAPKCLLGLPGDALAWQTLLRLL